jgi:hypothetical protein
MPKQEQLLDPGLKSYRRETHKRLGKGNDSLCGLNGEDLTFADTRGRAEDHRISCPRCHTLNRKG